MPLDGRAVEDMIDISQVAHFILVDRCSSAPPEVLIVGMIDLLSTEGAVFDEDPANWDPQALPTIDALLVLKKGDVYRITKRADCVRITSPQGHGSFRQPAGGGSLKKGLSNAKGTSIKDMNDLAGQIGVDLACDPNLKKNRLWREGLVSSVLELGDISKIVVYQSTTRGPLESDLKKVLTLIEHGRAIEPEQQRMNPVQMRAHVPLVSALLVTRGKAYYRIVIRENIAEMTSVEGHGYFAVASDPD